MPPRTCEVLRCTEPSARAVRLGADDAPLFEGVVCEGHWARIEAGAPVRWDADPTGRTRGALIMGTDLEAAGLTIIEVVAVEEHGLVLPSDGGPAVTLVLEKLNADASREEVRLTMSSEVMDHLGSLFEAYWRRRPGEQPPADT
jgi:hypothetical protein